MTSSIPALRAAAIRSVWTCDTKPSVGTDDSSGSDLSEAIVSSGLVFALFRSKMTKRGPKRSRLLENLRRRAGEHQLDARLLCGGADLRAEEQVVNGSHDHWPIIAHLLRQRRGGGLEANRAA